MDWLDFKEFVKDTFQYFLIFLGVILTVVYVISFSQIVGPSMNPTFNNGDITLLNKAEYRFFKVDRGDVISFSTKTDKYLIKRVVGLPGEHIEVKDNNLYIDGELYPEDYLPESTITEDFKLENLPYNLNDTKEPYQVIPKDMYLVLGDNRTNSDDSRKFGLIKKEDIIGHVVLRIFPFDQIKIIK